MLALLHAKPGFAEVKGDLHFAQAWLALEERQHGCRTPKTHCDFFGDSQFMMVPI